MYAFFATTAAKQKERKDGQQHACPLPEVELFVIDEQSPNERHDRTGGVDWSYQRERQMFDGKVAANP